MKRAARYRILGVPVTCCLLLLAATLAGYWMLVSNLFMLKNDALVYFLPARNHLAESIRSGCMPWWSPYLHMGYPIHGDMQAGIWNPVVWIFALFGRYNMSSLLWETLFYFFMAGIGFYKLSGITNSGTKTRLIVAVSYMFSGFMLDTAQITAWSASAAFLPFFLLYVHRITFQSGNAAMNGLKGAIAFHMMLVAGYPSFLIMAGYLSAAIVITGLAGKWRNQRPRIDDIAKTGSGLITLLTGFFLLSLPALLSYLDYLPEYLRSEGTSLAEAQQNPFDLFGIISAIFPFSVSRPHQWLGTNQTARSLYFGLFSLLFIFLPIRKRWTGTDWFLAAGSLTMFLFSLGEVTPVREFFYRWIPGFNLFRHPGTARIFVIIGLLLLAARPMDLFFQHTAQYRKLLIRSALMLIMIVAGLTAMLISVNKTGIAESPLQPLPGFQSAATWYASLGFPDALLIDGILQVMFLLAFIAAMAKRSIPDKFLAAVFMMNMIVPAQLSIPNGILSKESPAVINQVIGNAPHGYPLPSGSTPMSDLIQQETVRYRGMGATAPYLKEICWIEQNVNPSISRDMKRVDEQKMIRDKIFENPVIYFADTLYRYEDSLAASRDNRKLMFQENAVTGRNYAVSSSGDSCRFTQFEPGKMIIRYYSTQRATLCIMQQFDANWTFEVDGKSVRAGQANMAFTYLDVPAGAHSIVARYKPFYLNYALFASTAGWIGIFALLLWRRRNEPSDI